MLTPRYAYVLQMAWDLHDGQVRKGTTIPCMSHLNAVSSMVLEHGANEDEYIAALLHDAVEDAEGLQTLEVIRGRFGAAVADIIEGCTETTEDPKPDWQSRNEANIAHMAHAVPSVRLVWNADKRHNARSILASAPLSKSVDWQET